MGGEKPEWLPVGWKVRVRVRSSGKKDKYYVNPSSGLKFSSKPEVLRYLKSSGKDRKVKELNKINSTKTVADNLPPGWIKEIRTKKKGNKTRRDPYYIDPVSGRHFRSMQEVVRYLESKGSEEAKSKPDDKSLVSVESGDHSQSSSREAKRRRLVDNKADKKVNGKESVNSGLTLASRLRSAAKKNVNMPKDNHLEQREEDDSLATEPFDKPQPVNRVKKRAHKMIEIKKLADRVVKKSADGGQRSKSDESSKVAALNNLDVLILEQRDEEDDSVAGNLSNKLPQVNVKEQVKGGRRRSMRLADSNLKDNVMENQSLPSGLQDAAEKIISKPRSNDLEQSEKDKKFTCKGRQRENLVRQKKRKTPNNKWTSDLSCRASKRVACEEIDHPSLEIKTSNKSGVSATPSGETEVTTTTANTDKAGPSYEPQIETAEKFSNDSIDHHSKCTTENLTNNQENIIGHDFKEDEMHDKNLNSSLEGLLMDPCIEFAVKTLTGAIPIEEVNKIGDSPVSSLSSPNQTSASSSKLPSGNIWADPCYEFAVKMLTGEMPVEDGSRFQISFQQPPNYSFSQFDALNKPCMRQQGVKGPSFSHAVNGSSQGNSVGPNRN